MTNGQKCGKTVKKTLKKVKKPSKIHKNHRKNAKMSKNRQKHWICPRTINNIGKQEKNQQKRGKIV